MKQHVSQPFLRDHAESCEGRHDKGQPTTACASGKEPKQRAGHFGSNARRFGSRALAATTSSVSLVQTGAPLSFSSWFACQARLLDIRLLALELIVVNWTNLPKVIFKTRCLPVAGSPHAAFQVRVARVPANPLYLDRCKDVRLAQYRSLPRAVPGSPAQRGAAPQRDMFAIMQL